METIRTFTFQHDGRQFLASVIADDDHGAPWDEEDGHGPVRESRTGRLHGASPKRPGELMLSDDGRWGALLYDFAEACRIARRDGWGVAGGRQPRESARAYAARAARADFDRMRAYALDHWYWVGVGVQLLDPHGGPIGESYDCTLWGIESDAGDYLHEVAADLAAECLHARGETQEQRAAAWRAALREARARRYWASRDVETLGG